MATPVVTCFLRNESDVLLLRRSDEVGSYPGRWGGVAGHAEGDPDGAARQEIREETGIDPDRVTPVRAGEPFDVADGERTWRVHPYLFDCPTRAVRTNWETSESAWVPPTEIRRRETVPRLWESYDRVRPSVATVTDDTSHGSAYISVRALEVLRDKAGLAATSDDRDREAVAQTARELRDARPSMVVVANRVNRAMATAEGERPAAIERAATATIADAHRADERAAAAAAARIGERVATLSRSGTVAQTLAKRGPTAVLVAESRPGREGVAVAEEVAADADVTLATDAAFADALARFEADTLVVGADRILPDGRVVNKVGTRGAALAAAHEGCEAVVVAASDKVATDATVERDQRDPAEVYAGDDIAVENPTFDVTPADAVTVVTERGVLDGDAIAEVAGEHRRHADWERETRQ